MSHTAPLSLLLALTIATVAVAQTMPPGQISRQQSVPTAAKSVAASTTPTLPGTTAAKKTGAANCKQNMNETGNPYHYRVFFPLMSQQCLEPAIINYFQVNGTTSIANQVQYLYNAKQSTNQVNADLFTATFPGFQAVLAATATTGSGQATPAASTGATTTPTTTAPTQTDTAATAVAKLEQGGDFNVRFPVPLARALTAQSTLDAKLLPNIGFTVNGLTSQATITESTEYSLNIPLEVYYELSSYESTGGVSSAVFFLDLKAGGELLIRP